MLSNSKRTQTGLAALMVVALLSGAAWAKGKPPKDPPPEPDPPPVTYVLTWLDAFPASYVNAINSRGHVVGSATSSDGEAFAFLYTPNSGMVDLNTLLPLDTAWLLSNARDINDNGQVVGNGFNGGLVKRAYRALLNGDDTEVLQVDEIGPLDFDDQHNSASGINDLGEVCGRMRYDGPPITRIAWYYNPDNPVTQIEPLLGGMNLYATTINNEAQILGPVEDSNGTLLYRAFPDDTLETAEFFHSPVGEEHTIWGNDMNDSGWFVGKTALEVVRKGKKVSVRFGAYRCDGVDFVDLGAGGLSEAYGINNHGDVVGVYSGNAGPGFVYLEEVNSGVLVNLDDAVTGDPVDLGIWFDAETKIYPRRINDSGQIAGQAYIGLVGAYRAFLLTPVP
jgi:probable HAF family extracellular repeat protein